MQTTNNGVTSLQLDQFGSITLSGGIILQLAGLNWIADNAFRGVTAPFVQLVRADSLQRLSAVQGVGVLHLHSVYCASITSITITRNTPLTSCGAGDTLATSNTLPSSGSSTSLSGSICVDNAAGTLFFALTLLPPNTLNIVHH